MLMKESLLEAVPPADRAFVRSFIETQMFAVYSDTVISTSCEGRQA